MSMMISAVPVTTPVQTTVKTANQAPANKPTETVAPTTDTFEKTEAKPQLPVTVLKWLSLQRFFRNKVL